MLIHPGKRPPLASGAQEDWEEAREAYLLEHAPGLKEHSAAQQWAFRQIEEEAQNRHLIRRRTTSLQPLLRRLPFPTGRERRLSCVATLRLWPRIFLRISEEGADGRCNGLSGRGTEPIPHP